jgi:hypothetical protein
MRRILWLIGTLIAGGCNCHAPLDVSPPLTPGITWVSDGGDHGWTWEDRNDWSYEIAKRFNLQSVVALTAHGGPNSDNVWCVETSHGLYSTALRAWELRAQYPNKTIILLSCNPQHDAALWMPTNVYFVTDSLWLEPDFVYQQQAQLTFKHRLIDVLYKLNCDWMPFRETDPDFGYVGTIWEFHEGTCRQRPVFSIKQ